MSFIKSFQIKKGYYFMQLSSASVLTTRGLIELDIMLHSV